jgi:hypothetical protein
MKSGWPNYYSAFDAANWVVDYLGFCLKTNINGHFKRDWQRVPALPQPFPIFSNRLQRFLNPHVSWHRFTGGVSTHA